MHTVHTIEGCLFIQKKLPFGRTWLESPMGPENLENLEKIMEKLQPIIAREKVIFVRIHPPVTTSPEHTSRTEKASQTEEMLRRSGWKKSSISHFPKATLTIDLTKTEQEILAQMKPKGRYNIKVAAKNGITIRKSEASSKEHFEKDLIAFHGLLKQTAKRDGFRVHPLAYYRTMLESLGSDHAQLFLAEAKGIPVAGLIATYSGKTATYYYGASSYEHRNLMAPYLLQWEVMRDARTRGHTTYDLFGIAPESEKAHPWQGVTDYKKKFGGTSIEYIGAWQRVTSPFWYAMYSVAKWLAGK